MDRAFEWSGMGAQYINYITLGLAVDAFSRYGRAQTLHADRLLKAGLTKILQTRGCLPDRQFSSEGSGTPRSMNLIKVINDLCCRSKPVNSPHRSEEICDTYPLSRSLPPTLPISSPRSRRIASRRRKLCAGCRTCYRRTGCRSPSRCSTHPTLTRVS